MAFEKFKGFLRRLKGMASTSLLRMIGEVAKNENLTSNRMMDAIDRWMNMYYGFAPWLSGDETEDETLVIPALIAAEVARNVTLEMDVAIKGSPMADYIQEQFMSVLGDIRTTTEYACAGGGVIFKPYVNGDKITTEVIQANGFYPYAFNASQKITGAYFIYHRWNGRKIYTRLENHLLEGDDYKITNRAYVSMIEGSLGKECSLAEVPEWADIQPEVLIRNIEAPLFAYFKIPLGNVVDTKSPLGVSVYSRAVSLIRDADKQYQRLLWEYSGGELAIDAPSDTFKKVNGKPMLPEGKERLFRANNFDSATTSGSLFQHWAPALRDDSYINGLNRMLMQIEDVCSISRGTLSDPSIVSKTAEELKQKKQRTYALVRDIQTSLGHAFDDLAYAMSVLATLYGLAPDGQYECLYRWDDSIIVDADTERARDMMEVREGLMTKYEFRMKWYGEDEATARKRVDEIDGMTDDVLIGFDDVPLDEEETE